MSEHLEVLKTYKIYVGGNFPRTESGRFYKVFDSEKELLANACLCSIKDVRDAVQSARGAFKSWKSRSAYNRGQILYRIAEMMESRRTEFEKQLSQIGFTASEAEADVNKAIDRLIYYAGWTDKYQQVFGSINPVASSHFNFSILEPTGVVGILSSENSPLLGLVSSIAASIAGGNTCVVLSSEAFPLPSITFAVVNILTGKKEELAEHFSSHMDVNAISYSDDLPFEMKKLIDEKASINVKRVIKNIISDWYDENAESPYFILDLQETKTTWHPIGY